MLGLGLHAAIVDVPVGGNMQSAKPGFMLTVTRLNLEGKVAEQTCISSPHPAKLIGKLHSLYKGCGIVELQHVNEQGYSRVYRSENDCAIEMLLYESLKWT